MRVDVGMYWHDGVGMQCLNALAQVLKCQTREQVLSGRLGSVVGFTHGYFFNLPFP